MKNKIIVGLGILATVTGLAIPIQVEAAERVTLSSDALNLENKTVEDDYREFFRNRANNPAEISNNFSDRVTISNEKYWNYLDGDDGIWEITDRVELSVNEPVSPPIFPTLPAARDNRFDGVERVRIKYELIP
ncbi:hypothetical protein H6G17_20075 [Chroococcidiopsis sp. FACHB-1243]|uniref:hypothetical protein n=1 Tax=Chroococcidiopsis sp. [FACHB-1243] TaxID=2692781 RepID=UPI00177FD17D|nr:hypothetical protein [Chroococcidiopsis sp. [FACHB-1243]]MBD2307770.1 hypothetical protein [Chroococcidiopsis sp. [FACHB-1243]]